MRVRTLQSELWLPRPIDEVFAFFGDAHNLDELTPAWLHFEVLTPRPIAMAPGARIEYRIRWHGLPMRWLTEITAWEPPHRFTDRQLRGPYRLWDHEHTFAERDGGTVVGDRVNYAVPGGPLEPLVHGLFVGGDVARIFDFRRDQMRRRFGDPTPVKDRNGSAHTP